MEAIHYTVRNVNFILASQGKAFSFVSEFIHIVISRQIRAFFLAIQFPTPRVVVNIVVSFLSESHTNLHCLWSSHIFGISQHVRSIHFSLLLIYLSIYLSICTTTALTFSKANRGEYVHTRSPTSQQLALSLRSKTFICKERKGIDKFVMSSKRKASTQK